MKILTIAVLLIYSSISGYSQCSNFISGQKLQKGMFIRSDPQTIDKKVYTAEILTVNGTDFTCRYLHSNSLYSFTDFKKADGGSNATMQATVKSSKGGGFQSGTQFKMNIYMADPDRCQLADATDKNPYFIIATFLADRKSYLGQIAAEKDGYVIHFFHSKSKYWTDRNFKVTHVEGGGYLVGSQMNVVHARTLQF